MKIIRFQVGFLGTNCYLACCERTAKCAIIDPGGNEQEILHQIQADRLTAECIINTHGHADHIMADQPLKTALAVPVCIHRDDAELLLDSRLNVSMFFGNGYTGEPADRLLTDGDIIKIGEENLRVIHTPGHTAGGICLQGNGILFSGDTLFYGSVGRTDFPGGSPQQMTASIKKLMNLLADEVKVYPGHGPETTIGRERKTNQWIIGRPR